MEVVPLQEIQGSSQIAAAGHDPASNTLAIKFHTGAVYHYSGVPAEVANGLMSADSKGRYFGAEIRGKFEHTRVDEGATQD